MGEHVNVQDRKNQRQMLQSEHERQDSDFENDDHVVRVAHDSVKGQTLDKRNPGVGNNARRPPPAPIVNTIQTRMPCSAKNTPRNTGSMGLAGSAKTQIR